MSRHALSILGFDEETHHPVHIELTLVDRSPATGPWLPLGFTAPRGFLAEEHLVAGTHRDGRGHTSCTDQAFGLSGGGRRTPKAQAVFAAPPRLHPRLGGR